MAIELTDRERELIALAVEDALKILPSVVQHLVAQVATLKETSQKFYADNKDLASHKEGMAKLIEELEAKSPGKTYEAVLNEAAGEARKRLASFGSLSLVAGAKPELKELDDHLKGML